MNNFDFFETDGVLDNARGKRKKGKQKAQTTAGKAPSGKPKGKPVKKALRFIVLRPFKRPMMKALDRRKIQYRRESIQDIAEKFLSNVVRKRNNFEDGFEDAVPPQAIAAGASAAGNIVQQIVDFFRDIKNKRKSGKATPEEREMLDDADKSLKAQNNQNNLILIGAGVVLLVIFARK